MCMVCKALEGDTPFLPPWGIILICFEGLTRPSKTHYLRLFYLAKRLKEGIGGLEKKGQGSSRNKIFGKRIFCKL